MSSSHIPCIVYFVENKITLQQSIETEIINPLRAPDNIWAWALILVPNSSQGTVGYDMEVCVTFQGYASSDHH